ncbi:MAG: TetR/AcrR family transcriptional regulator [Desulfomonile tiedjei]|nr:TetR/AcrR family transcriptional regulator [Desulfomonile tiedjei]
MPRDKTQPQKTSADSSVAHRIVAAARRHFFAYGFRSVTMDDLAEELGMSKKTLYAHFPSKAALVEAVFLDKFHEVEADLERITSQCSSDFLAGMRQLLACMQRHLEEIRPPWVRDVLRDAPQIFEMAQVRRRAMIHRHFGKLVGEGRSAGFLRKDIPANLIIEILLAAVQGIINPEKLAELSITPKVGFSTIITVIFEGVITETGRSKL